MSKTRSLKMKGLSLLVAVVMAMAALPLVATPALATALEYRMLVVAEPATVTPGETFEVRVTVDSPAAGGGLRSAEFKEFHFDHTLMEMVSMRGATESGEPWFGATFFTAPEDQIDEANATGTLSFPIGGVFWTAPPGPTPYGEIKFVFIEMKALPGTVGTHTVPLAVDVFFMQNGLLEVITDPYIEGIPGEVVIEGPADPIADLTVPAVSADWVVVGETYNVTFTITNQGDLDAPVSTTSILIDGTEVGPEACSALAAGASETKTVGPFTLSGDSDTIEVIADKADVVTEGNEGNNSKTITVADVLPDLTVPAVSADWVVVGETYNVTFTIKNEGDADAVASTTSILIDGTEEATEACSALAAGASETKTVGPFTLSGDSDTIEVIADKADVVTEGNEGNNSKTITATPPPVLGPDLYVKALVWDWEADGETYTVTFTIKNCVHALASVGSSMAEITTIVGNITDEVAWAVIPALGIGEKHTATVGPFTWTEPVDVKVTADYLFEFAELDEGNNSRIVTIDGPVVHEGVVVVTGDIDPCFASIDVPDFFTIDLDRGVVNTAELGVTITSNTQWQLHVADTKVENRGHMVCPADDVALKNPMEVVEGVTVVNLADGGVLAVGNDDSGVAAVLQQFVEYTDPAGNYQITITFTVTGIF